MSPRCSSYWKWSTIFSSWAQHTFFTLRVACILDFIGIYDYLSLILTSICGKKLTTSDVRRFEQTFIIASNLYESSFSWVSPLRDRVSQCRHLFSPQVPSPLPFCNAHPTGSYSAGHLSGATLICAYFDAYFKFAQACALQLLQEKIC